MVIVVKKNNQKEWLGLNFKFYDIYFLFFVIFFNFALIICKNFEIMGTLLIKQVTLNGEKKDIYIVDNIISKIADKVDVKADETSAESSSRHRILRERELSEEESDTGSSSAISTE